MSAVMAARVRAVSTADAVDALGSIKAEISGLKETERLYVEILKKSKKQEIDGKLYRATISRYDRESIPQEILMEKLGSLMDTKAFRAWVRKHTVSVPTTVVKVVARKT
jgi:hypothetical protein